MPVEIVGVARSTVPVSAAGREVASFGVSMVPLPLDLRPGPALQDNVPVRSFFGARRLTVKEFAVEVPPIRHALPYPGIGLEDGAPLREDRVPVVWRRGCDPV